MLGMYAYGARSLVAHDFDFAWGVHRFDPDPFQPHRRGPCHDPVRPWYSPLHGRQPYVEGRDGDEVAWGGVRSSCVVRVRYPIRHRVPRQFSRALRPQPRESLPTRTLTEEATGTIDAQSGHTSSGSEVEEAVVGGAFVEGIGMADGFLGKSWCLCVGTDGG